MSTLDVVRSLANSFKQKQYQQKQLANKRYLYNGQRVNIRQLPIEIRREISRQGNVLNLHKQKNAHNIFKGNKK